MSDPSLVLALESRLINAWPSFEVQLCDGWLMRFARGYSKRANSASPILPGASLDDALIDHMVARFLDQNVRPTFRLTTLQAPEVDERLARRGFVEIDPSLCLTLAIPEEYCVDPSVAVPPAVTDEWVQDTAQSYGGEKADDRLLVEIVSRIRQPAAFATLSLDDRPVAWGLGVAERGYVGLYDIVVSPDLRGLGLGRRILESLAAWGRDQGATHAYLQVRGENEVARALYESMGFQVAYRYSHRVMP